MTPTKSVSAIVLGSLASALSIALAAPSAGAVTGSPQPLRAIESADTAHPSGIEPGHVSGLVVVTDPVPGLLGVVPCLITTGSAGFCAGIT